MSRSIQERNIAVAQINAVRAYMLRDTARLGGLYVRFADIVEYGGLAVVDVTDRKSVV